MSGNLYQGGKNGIGNTLIIRNNIQNNGEYGIYFPCQESFRNIIISENTFSNLSHQGVYLKFLIDGVNLNISKNTFANIKRDGVYIDGNSFTNGAVKILNNILINVYPSNSNSRITIKNVQNAEISGNQASKTQVSKTQVSKTQVSRTQVSKVPVAAFSASPTSGYSPLRVKFTDRSTGSLASWKWSFGDGKYSTQKNPIHKYTEAGKFTVKLTVENSKGTNSVTKPGYIVVK
jgi:PKD repeat protein